MLLVQILVPKTCSTLFVRDARLGSHGCGFRRFVSRRSLCPRCWSCEDNLDFLGVVTRAKLLVIQIKNRVVLNALERPRGLSQYVLR